MLRQRLRSSKHRCPSERMATRLPRTKDFTDSFIASIINGHAFSVRELIPIKHSVIKENTKLIPGVCRGWLLAVSHTYEHARSSAHERDQTAVDTTQHDAQQSYSQTVGK